MKKITTIAGAVAAALLIATFAQAETKLPTARKVTRTIAPMQTQVDPVITKAAPYRKHYRIACVADGTPVEFPNDLVFTNRGAVIPAGTKLNWAMVGHGFSGVYTLGSALQTGGAVRVSNVLPGGVEAGKSCQVAAQ